MPHAAKAALCLFAFSAIFLASPASAAVQINPKCAVHRTGQGNIIACTCTLEAGGYIAPDGSFHYSGRQTPAFSACMQNSGLK
jgi:hypothetical protein